MKYISKNLDDTRKIAEDFASNLKCGDVITLNGDLGAGKTTFTQFVFKYLGVKEAVSSPTFAVLKTYKTEKFVLNHFDAYRINTDEAIECGFDEVLSDKNSISFIEWAENIKELIPKRHFVITISFVENCRQFEIERV